MHKIFESILPGDLVFDIGAHAGRKIEGLLALRARVVAAEPQPEMVRVLAEKFRGVGAVTIVPKAVGAEIGSLPMSINAKSTTISTLSDEWKRGRFASETWSEQIQVDVTTLDELIYAHGTPRFIKIDVEGFERQVIGGLSKKAGCLSFEFTREYFHNAEAICGRLQSLGYRNFNASFGESEQFASNKWIEDLSGFLQALKNEGRRNNDLWGDIYAV